VGGAPLAYAAPHHPAVLASTKAPTTPLGWLVAEAKPFNGKLNRDQEAVLVASRSTGEVTAGQYYAHLASSCTAMLRDARHASHLPTAPSTSLQSAWHAMTTATETYASDCLALTRSRNSASFTRWNKSLEAMDTASAALNTVVAQVRQSAG
jgi:hypothetical protein